jgi:hypothetical protein
VHSTLLFTQLLAPCLFHFFPDLKASSQSSPERNSRTKLLTKFLIGLRSSLASSGEKEEAGRIVLETIKRTPSLRSSAVLHELLLLLGPSSRLVDDAWELVQGDDKMLFSVAATVSFLPFVYPFPLSLCLVTSTLLIDIVDVSRFST